MGLTEIFFRTDRRAPARRNPTEAEATAEEVDAKAERALHANLVLRLWQAFTEGFRDDERAHEEARFREAAAAIDERLAALGPDAAPDPATARRMLWLLATALRMRVEDLHDRIDDLANACRERDGELNVLKLGSCWQTDELERCRAMIVEGLRGRETVLPMVGPDGERPPLSELLAALLDVRRPPPPAVAHEGRRQTARDEEPAARAPDAPPPAQESEGAMVARILREALAGQASVGRLARVLEDKELAQRLVDLGAENRRQRELLVRIGLLPRT